MIRRTEEKSSANSHGEQGAMLFFFERADLSHPILQRPRLVAWSRALVSCQMPLRMIYKHSSKSAGYLGSCLDLEGYLYVLLDTLCVKYVNLTVM